MLKLVLMLAVVTAVVYGLSHVVAKRYGADVRQRFLETPPTATRYTAQSLTEWTTTHAADARGYAAPVLFPVDLVLMIFLAASLGVIAVGLAGQVRGLDGLV
ncbi:MAG: hypothetical protein HY216_17225, partial [Candidatus Rokubacteria bacterium]|nr:hypothetical protein [Candidatus Rokubacteria bacterium]